ncbi:MAG: ABC transporter ATP-binding protein [Burkholderiales bacterium]
MAVIETKGLTKYYGRNRGIVDVDLSVNEGEIFGFIGPNGAGKSTMIKTLLGMIFPTRGSAEIFGLDCVRRSHVIKRQIGYVPSEVRLYDDITVRRMLRFSGSFYPDASEEYTRALMDAFELEPDKKIGELSSGNKKKTALVAALASRSKLLILDEPTSGLDPLMRRTLFDALLRERQKGATVFLSSHNLDEVESLCSRVAIIREGSIADVKKVSELSAAGGKKVKVKGGRPEITERVQNVKRTGDTLEFTYRGSAAELLAMLSSWDVEDFTAEDVSLSDVFMSYYK